MESMRSIRRLVAIVGLVTAGATALAGCAGSGAQSAGGNGAVVHGSLALTVKSFAQARQMSAAIVEGVAGETTDETVRTGGLKGVPLAQTRFTVTKVVWGKLGASTVTVSALRSAEGEGHPLRAGQRYLLFLTPASLDPAPDEYSVTATIGYSLEGDTYVYNGGADDADVPERLPVGTAEQQVVS